MVVTRRISAGEVNPAAVVEHRRHPGADRHLVDLQPVGLLSDQFAKIVGEFENLEDTQPPAITEAAAALTTARLVQRLAGAEPERAEPWVFGEIRLGKGSW
jgi:hypothetical protein